MHSGIGFVVPELHVWELDGNPEVVDECKSARSSFEWVKLQDWWTEIAACSMMK